MFDSDELELLNVEISYHLTGVRAALGRQLQTKPQDVWEGAGLGRAFQLQLAGAPLGF